MIDAYNIDKYDVTNSQYAEFLNTKDPTGANTFNLWNSNMANGTYAGISFDPGNANGSKYSVIPGNEQHPVNYESWYAAIRFANWLNNGQGNGDTETGAYTLGPLFGSGGEPIKGDSITRNAGATVFLPTANEWFKAAFYNPSDSSYYQYPTSSNTVPTATSPTATPNSANYSNAVGNLTDVGAYTGTTSPYGAYDMGSNVINWVETLVRHPDSPGTRELWGASFGGSSVNMHLTTSGSSFFPTVSSGGFGFRVASIPEPSSVVLAALGFVTLAVWSWRKRKH